MMLSLIHIFSGQVEITVGETVYRLSKGDSICFDADVPHAYRNPGTEMTELSMLIFYHK